VVRVGGENKGVAASPLQRKNKKNIWKDFFISEPTSRVSHSEKKGKKKAPVRKNSLEGISGSSPQRGTGEAN